MRTRTRDVSDYLKQRRRERTPSGKLKRLEKLLREMQVSADYKNDPANIEGMGGEPSAYFALGAIGSQVALALEIVNE